MAATDRSTGCAKQRGPGRRSAALFHRRCPVESRHPGSCDGAIDQICLRPRPARRPLAILLAMPFEAHFPQGAAVSDLGTRSMGIHAGRKGGGQRWILRRGFPYEECAETCSRQPTAGVARVKAPRAVAYHVAWTSPPAVVVVRPGVPAQTGCGKNQRRATRWPLGDGVPSCMPEGIVGLIAVGTGLRNFRLLPRRRYLFPARFVELS
jgi:hypothetical protein